MSKVMTNQSVLVHKHIFGNAGEFVDQYLHASFGVRWQQIDHRFQKSNHLTEHEVLSVVNEGQLLRAASTMTPLSQDQSGLLRSFTLIADPVVRAWQVFLRVAGDSTQPNHDIAKERGFRGYIEWALGGGRGGVVVRNYQTLHLSDAHLRTSDIVDAEAGTQECEESKNNLSKLNFIGLADRPVCSMHALQQANGDFFPELKLESFLRYFADQKRQTLDEQRAAVKCELGESIFNRLVEANCFDAQLYDFAQERFSELHRKCTLNDKECRCLNKETELEQKPSRKVFFLHIPKTAGTAFSLHLKNQFNHQDICPAGYWPELLAIDSSKREQYKLISGHFSDLGHVFLNGNPQLVTVLREPVNRVISLIFYQRHLANSAPQNFLNQTVAELAVSARGKYNKDIEAIVNTDDFRILQGISNYQTRVLSGGQVEPAYSLNDRHLEQAKKNLLRYKMIGLTEYMQESLNMLSYFMGWSPVDDFVINETPTTQERERLPQYIIEKILELNSLDLQLYAFAKDLFFKQRSSIPFPLATQAGQDAFFTFYYKNYGPPQQSSFSSKLSFGPVGSSWWEWESRPNGGGCRWTGPEADSYMNLPIIKSQPLLIAFRISGYASEAILSSAVISADGERLTTEVLINYVGEIYLQAVAERSRLNLNLPFLRVGVHLVATMPAREINPAASNNRRLGVAIHAVDVRPIEESKLT